MRFVSSVLPILLAGRMAEGFLLTTPSSTTTASISNSKEPRVTIRLNGGSSEHNHEGQPRRQQRRSNEEDVVSRGGIPSLLQDHVVKMAATVLLTASLWGAPAVFAPTSTPFGLDSSSSSGVVAVAREMASGTGSRVNKDPESLLRYGLPISSKEVRQLQATIEDIKTDIGSKRKSAALDKAKKSKTKLNQDASKLTAACGPNKSTCTKILGAMGEQVGPLEDALRDSMDAFQGSEQEREALDKAYESQESLAAQVTSLEEAMVPPGYVTPVPAEYSDLPQLLGGRATVEMTFKKGDNSVFVVDAKNYKEGKMKMIIDGYTAPVTGGNFVDLVQKGFYNNMAIQRSDGFVVQTGDPDGEAVGYTGGKASQSIGAGPHGERLIPLETFMLGDKAPFYETTMEDEGRGGQATVLPFSSYGAMGWAREEFDPNSGSSQFFWLLFDSDLTPAGKNVLDGRYPCFGYVVEGSDFLSELKEGDIITSAKVTKGLEFLKQPAS